MDQQADGLADGRGGAVRERHEPRLGRGGGEGGDGGDAGAERKALEGLVKADGDEEDDEGGAGRDAEGHADEDGVEEDAGFEEEALEEHLLLLLLAGEGRLWVGGFFSVGGGVIW